GWVSGWGGLLCRLAKGSSSSFTSSCSCGVIAGLLACSAATYVGCRAGIVQVVPDHLRFLSGVWAVRRQPRNRLLNRVGACRAGARTGVTGSYRGTPEQEAGFYRVVRMDRDVYVWAGQGSATVANIGQVLQQLER